MAIERSLYNNLSVQLLKQSIDFKVVESNQQVLDLMKNNKMKYVLASVYLLEEWFKRIALSYGQHELTDVGSISFRFVFNQKMPVLQSIFKKSLSYIQRASIKKDNKEAQYKTINVISQRAPLPYSPEKGIITAISHDIVLAVFSSANMVVNKYSYADGEVISESFSIGENMMLYQWSSQRQRTMTTFILRNSFLILKLLCRN